MLSLRELLRDLDVRLLCGEGSLDAPVRWVHISELADPTPWLSGGEVLLTTGLQLDTPRKQRDFVGRLVEHDLAGLGLGTGLAHRSVPKALAAAAEAHDFPLFEVPYELPFIAVTEKAFTRLVNEQYTILQRSIAAHERLERIVLSQRGLEAVLSALSSLVGGTAAVFDARGDLLGRHEFRRPLGEEALAALGENLRERQRTTGAEGANGAGGGGTFVPDHPELAGRGLVLPVAALGTPERPGAAPLAWLLAAKDSGPLSEFDRLILHHAVTIVALELLRRRVAEDTERRLAGDVLSSAVNGELAGPELARRLEPFGISAGVGAMVLSPARGALAQCEAALASALREEAADGLVAVNDTLVCALLPGSTEEEVFDLAERARQRVSAQLGTPLAAGAGRTVPAGQARRAYHEARCALDARALATGESNGDAGLATYRDLGSFQLLLSLQDDDALRLFCDSILGPIETGEGHYGGELMRSLEAFIECNGQWEAAARKLYCHRHTLRYRMRKVEELTGRDLSNAQDRIEFWLALRGRELAPNVAVAGR